MNNSSVLSAEYSYDNCNGADTKNCGLLSKAGSSGEEDKIEVNVFVREEDEAEHC